VGYGKSCMLDNKSGNISETRKDRGKVTMDGLSKLTNALSNGTIPDPLWPPLPQNWGFATQLPPLISGTGKATDFKFGGYIYRANRNKSPLKIYEKMERGRIQRLPNFFWGGRGVTPIISATGKATDFKFGGYIYRDNPNKSLLKILEKRERGRIQGVP